MASEHKVCLVTGGAGFLGSFLCERLLTQGHRVICWDNLCTGSQANVTYLKKHERFTFMRCDVTNAHPVPHEVDEIYNLACPASPKHYSSDPVQTLKTNVLGALNLLAQAQYIGARILQASTSEIYGDPQVHPQSESYWGHVNAMGPRSCYDEGKRAAETLFYDYHHSHGVDVRVARIFNTYGPRMSVEDGRVVSNFIVRALQGQPLTIYGDGSQTRSFCFVDDLVTGLIALMRHAFPHAQAVNLGNPTETTVFQLAEMICNLVENNAGIDYAPLPQDDPMQRCPDIAQANALLGWAPRVSLEEGLKRTIAYFRPHVLAHAA